MWIELWGISSLLVSMRFLVTFVCIYFAIPDWCRHVQVVLPGHQRKLTNCSNKRFHIHHAGNILGRACALTWITNISIAFPLHETIWKSRNVWGIRSVDRFDSRNLEGRQILRNAYQLVLSKNCRGGRNWSAPLVDLVHRRTSAWSRVESGRVAKSSNSRPRQPRRLLMNPSTFVHILESSESCWLSSYEVPSRSRVKFSIIDRLNRRMTSELKNPTSTWETVSNTYYRKIKSYSAAWTENEDFNLDDYILAGAPFGGALGRW